MAVQVPAELNWLFDALVGQEWPQGDEGLLRDVLAEAWAAALRGIVELAGHGDAAARQVGVNVDAVSVDDFTAYWDKYTAGDESSLGQLARQCEALASTCLGQANEVEYTKLSIVILLILVAIQIAWAVAAAVGTLGGSLAEVPLAMLIGRQSVLMVAGRLLQMVLMMMVPDLVTQVIMLAQGRGWDWGKTGSAAGNAVIAGALGAVLGAGVARLPFMTEEVAAGLGGKVLQGVVHVAEGGTVNAATGLTMDLLTGQQVDPAKLLQQFASGGVLAGAFYLPHLAGPHGVPLSFAGPDGTVHQVVLDPAAQAAFEANGNQLPDGWSGPVFNQQGLRTGTATFHVWDSATPGDAGPGLVAGPPVIEQRPAFTVDSTGMFGDGSQHVVDLSAQGYSVGGHDGSVTTYGPNGQVMSYVRPSDGTVQIETGQGPVTVPEGSMVHYAGDGAPLSVADGTNVAGLAYRADVAAEPNTVTVYQSDVPGQVMDLTGRAVHTGGVGQFLGVDAPRYYAPDGTRVAAAPVVFGQLNVSDQAAFTQAFGDHYNPFTALHGYAAGAQYATSQAGPTMLAGVAGLLPGPGHEGAAGPGPVIVDSVAAESAAAAGGQAGLPVVVLPDLMSVLAAHAATALGEAQAAAFAGGGPGQGFGPQLGHVVAAGHDGGTPLTPTGYGDGSVLAVVPVPPGLVPMQAPPGFEHLTGMLFQPADGGGLVVYGGTDPKMLAAASLTPSDGTAFPVNVVGGGGHAWAGQPLSGGDLVKLMAAAGWDGSQPAVLVSCDGAVGGHQSLLADVQSQADQLFPGAQVAGSTQWAFQNLATGKVVLAARMWDEAAGQFVPDRSQPGQWVVLNRDGAQVVLPADENGMPVFGHAPDGAGQQAGPGLADAAGPWVHWAQAGGAVLDAPPGPADNASIADALLRSVDLGGPGSGLTSQAPDLTSQAPDLTGQAPDHAAQADLTGQPPGLAGQGLDLGAQPLADHTAPAPDLTGRVPDLTGQGLDLGAQPLADHTAPAPDLTGRVPDLSAQQAPDASVQQAPQAAVPESTAGGQHGLGAGDGMTGQVSSHASGDGTVPGDATHLATADLTGQGPAAGHDAGAPGRGTGARPSSRPMAWASTSPWWPWIARPRWIARPPP